jgi:hypothetical protein
MLIALQALDLRGAPLVKVDPGNGTVRATSSVLGAWEGFEPQHASPRTDPVLPPDEFRDGRLVRLRAGGRFMVAPLAQGTGVVVTARGPVTPFKLKKLSGSSSGPTIRDGDIIALCTNDRHVRAESDGVLRMRAGSPDSKSGARFRAIVDIGVKSVVVLDGAGNQVGDLDFRRIIGVSTTVQVCVTTRNPAYPFPTDAVLFTPSSGRLSNIPELDRAWRSPEARRSALGVGPVLPTIPITVNDPLNRPAPGDPKTSPLVIRAALWPEEFYSEEIERSLRHRASWTINIRSSLAI